MSTQHAIVVQGRGHAALKVRVPVPAMPEDSVLIRSLPTLTMGFVHGCNAMHPGVRAFAEYVIARGDLQMRLPDFMGFEAGATLGVGLATVGQNLYHNATATGTLAIQLAKLSGLRVITTCSGTNRRFMHELGADLICGAAISSDGGKYSSLLYVPCTRRDVDAHVSMAYDLLGERYRLGASEVAEDPASLKFGIEWAARVEPLPQDRRIIPHPFQVKPGGLGGVLDGLQLLREGQVRASKLVYRVDATE
ncbi:hypothetical protein BO71DRAFT_450804 [Aspergillus ellipticus CBS 707.79]|uniref:Uncharacterized protein n=1 Tax=Aspergillus ellipticus CBS 707.79 TaxID=1448320 RepID=A0A319DGL5_9EURO|nr:hypothetical protein BO71DRAFT_450804 [Aspergillus ellipticus CBS 707.79]